MTPPAKRIGGGGAQLHMVLREKPFQTLLSLQVEWYVKGRDTGLAFTATVAIHLAEASVAQARNADECGAAFNDLAIVLRTLGQRETDTGLLQSHRL